MGAAIACAVILGITILAFTFKIGPLYIASVPAWVIQGFILYNQTYAGNTFLGYALILLCVGVAIVMLIMTLNHYLFSKNLPMISDEEMQNDYRRQVYNLTRRKRDFWGR